MKALKISLTIVVELAIIYLFSKMVGQVIFGELFPWQSSNICNYVVNYYE